MPTEHLLAYDAPAAQWLEALPLGNGRLGAMVFGGNQARGAVEHRFQLNDSSAWSGSPHSQDREPAFSREEADRILTESRRRIGAGNFAGATETLKGLQHRHSQAYLPFADLYITASLAGADAAAGGTEGGLPPEDPSSDYHRGLDLARALNTNTYCLDGHAVRVDAFISHDPSVLVISLWTEAPQGLDLAVRLDSPLRILRRSGGDGALALELKLPSDAAPAHDGGLVEYSEDNSLSMQGAVAAAWEHDGLLVHEPSRSAGQAVEHDGGLAATGVRHAEIYLTTETTFAGLARQPQGTAATAAAAARAVLDGARASGWAALQDRHGDSHSRLYQSASIELDVPAWEGRDTGRRLLAANAHPDGPLAADPGLAALLFNYGRYLLISSSRSGPENSRQGSAWRGVPANLQGIWNGELAAPWSSNYTTNINLQMNYWGAEPTGLAECVQPLFALIEAMQGTGSAVAQEYYGARGWTVHHNSDIWAYAKPVGHGSHSPEWAYWPMAGMWLVRHLWEHLQFGTARGQSGDRNGFVRDSAWPAIRGAAEFALDLLVDFPDGSVGTSPSTSPENTFATVDPSTGRRVQGSVARSSTMDLTLIGDVFRMLDALARHLGLAEDPVARAARRALPRLPAPAPGRDGKLREWLADPQEWELEHRHVSHLYLAYPGDTPLTPELEAAVCASLDGRGDEATGWSLAWKILLRARLRQAGRVSDLFRLFFRDMGTPRGGQSGGLFPNLFGAHPPFQIDGNLGFVAALAECLIQSHRTINGLQEIELLPALPPELPGGCAERLRARPGVEVDLNWLDGRLSHATLSARKHSKVLVRYGTAVTEVQLQPGKPAVLTVSPAGALHIDTIGYPNAAV